MLGVRADRHDARTPDSSCASQGDDRKVLGPFEPRQLELEEPVAALLHFRRMPSRERIARARLDARLPTRRKSTIANFLGRRAAERLMRPPPVVPERASRDGTLEVGEAEWDETSAERLVLRAADEALDDGDAAVLADGAVPRTDAAALAPIFIFGLKLYTLVAHEMTRRSSGVRDGTRSIAQISAAVGSLRNTSTRTTAREK